MICSFLLPVWGACGAPNRKEKRGLGAVAFDPGRRRGNPAFGPLGEAVKKLAKSGARLDFERSIMVWVQEGMDMDCASGAMI
jgi:hypothetical protein